MALLPNQRRRGFSIVELLVVVAIIAVLIGLMIPAILRMRGVSDRTVCQNNLRELGSAVHQHHDQFHAMPPYVGDVSGTAASWFYYLMPYVGLEQPTRLKLHGSLVGATGQFPVLTCKSDPTLTLEPDLSKTNYLANWYVFTNTAQGCFAPPQTFASLSNGLSNVVMFAEAYGVCGKTPRPALESPYYHNFGVTGEDFPSDDPKYLPTDYTMFQVKPGFNPASVTCDHWRAQTPHEVMHACLADGSVRSIQPSIDPQMWKRAMKPRTGQLPGGDW